MKYIWLILCAAALSVNACQENKALQDKDDAAKYVSLLTANKYPKYDILPKLEKKDIGVLLKQAGNNDIIENYPIPALSAAAYGPQKVGMIILYTVESIRQQRPVGVSNRPFITDTTAPQRKVELAEVAGLYTSWWDQHKDKTAAELKNISPLEGTPFKW
ncbi:DUF4943 family protein [Chitinophaga sp. 22321]|uniref:DUF4943 family protein n=1 Tax=Chitinophaga hostae TaxID=2831022 RepID=A0ABS5J9F4_9BACT|nr:DUF4943 family protein [Chitinophaga hostae]MBS0031846.1 DUF4943 family protein [Chitinophaga hostae]